MTNSLFAGNTTDAQRRGRVKDFINWNMPLLTGREADYGASPTGTYGHGGSQYWIDQLTGSSAGNIAAQNAAAAHEGGWQGWLADSFRNANAAERAAGTTDWNPTGWYNTSTGRRTNYDPNTPFLRLSDLRNTAGYTDPEGSNYTVAGDFQGRKYDPMAALAASTAANFMGPAADADASTTTGADTTTGDDTTTGATPSVDDIKNWITQSYQSIFDRDPEFTGDVADEKADYWIGQMQNALASGEISASDPAGILAWMDNHLMASGEYTNMNNGTTGGENGTTGGENGTTGGENTVTGAPTTDEIKNYLGSAYKLYLNRDPVYNDDFTDTADYWIQEVQNRFNNNEFGGENDTWQDWLSKSIRGGEEYKGLYDLGGGETTGGWWDQFADADAFKTFLQAGTPAQSNQDMQQFMQFMMFMNMMQPRGGGGYGGSQYGYGGLNPGGVQSAYNPMSNMASMMEMFKTLPGISTNTVNTGTTGGNSGN